MNYNEFKKETQNQPLVLSSDLLALKESKQAIRNQLERWRKKKLLIRLKRGVFLLNQSDRKLNISRAYIANQLYSPSYVSVEYALNYYGLIPERTNDLTSVSAKKTLRIVNETGNFIYQHIKPQAFRGFKAQKDDAGLAFFIAVPEKAIVDFIYLNLNKFKVQDKSIFEESYRFQNLEVLKTKIIMEFAKGFNSDKLLRVCKLFCEFAKKEGAK
ncbi:MAG: hypothetical protein V2A72_01735 [Candidatus Omnitrophota bacterium]